MSDSALHVALLAPVPSQHLEAGFVVCREKGRVAFGSRAWEVFRELDALCKGLPVDVYFYASQADCGSPLKVTWHARYIGHVESHGGAHPEGMRFRPASTAKYKNDNEGHWAIFWEVECLQKLKEESERIPLTEFLGIKKGKSYKVGFIPEGPLLVQQPR